MFPSELEFFSFLQYAPQGQSDVSRLSKRACRAVKSDGFLPGPFWAIKEAAERIAQTLDQYPFLKTCFAPDVALIPAPRSSPLSDKNALWPALRICEEILKQGLAKDLLPVLERVRPVTKAATAGPGQRPPPLEHYESTRVKSQLPFKPSRITLVDDVVTQGSTFLGFYRRLQEAFPNVEISCFALIRTMSGMEIEKMLEPVQGKITFQHGPPHREP